MESVPTDRAALEAMISSIVDQKLNDKLDPITARIEEAFARLDDVEADMLTDRATIVVFSGDFDRLIAAFIIATGAVAMGMEVSMYFTFWGLTALKKQTHYAGKTLPEKMVSMMIPSGAGSVGTSRLNMLGMGPAFFKMLMKQNNVETLPDLVKLAKELEVKMIACQMSMGVMGIKEDELMDDIDFGGVATYLGDAGDSKLTLFI
jgi:peroxiredoxin family protein